MRNTSSQMCRITLALSWLSAGATLGACMGTGSLFGDPSAAGKVDRSAATGAFDGCLDGTPLDQTRIRVTVTFPEKATRMSIFRDGVQIATLSAGGTTFTDTGLSEGQTYRYTCEATINGLATLGAKQLTVQTIALNAPNFGGATSVAAQSSSVVRINWVPPTGSPPADTYKVYYNAGATVDWTQPAKATVTAGTFFYNAPSLGDQIPYAFGVRACAAGAVCDSNTVVRAATPPDGGAPRTTGVSSVTANNGKLSVIAPWNDSLGAVLRRKVYLRQGAVGGLTLADYTLARTEFVSNLAAAPTTILVSGVSENTMYHVIVVDEDPSSQANTPPTTFFTINTGDMTPPAFSGISGVTHVAGFEDTQVDIAFTAVDRQNTAELNMNGTAAYAVYVASAAYPTAPTAACDQTVPVAVFGSDTYAPGAATYRLSGLVARNTYSICIKAQDNAGNTSTNLNALTITMRDITPPVFDGIQAIDFVPDSGSLQAMWVASPSSDVTTYRVRLWKNVLPAAVVAGDITTFTKSAATFSTGWNITGADYTFTDFDAVYIVVDACDNANTIPGGVAACTSFAYTTAKSISLPDISPPAGFLGVAAAGSLTATVQGQVTVRWAVTGGQWGTGYQGFRIYDYNTGTGSLTFLKDCPCADGTCDGVGVGDTECDVTGLDAFRTYWFHVRAFDAGGNLTQLNPLTSNSAKRTADSTVPVFSSALTVGAAPTYTLNWDAASDNQYPSEPGAVINYQVYRKIGSNFTDPYAPYSDGGATLQVSQSSRSYNDSLLEGVTHYYVVCALDMSTNRVCDGANVKSFTTTDLTPPTITNLATTWDKKKKRWNMSWTMADSITPAGSLLVNVYRHVDDSYVWATNADDLIESSAGITSVSNLTGATGLLKYITYLVVVRDLAGNTVSAKTRLKVDNRITITSVKRNVGPTAGGRWIHIRGTGFTRGSENGYGTSTAVTLGGSACTSLDVISDERIICKTPAGSNGSVEVRATNPDGATAALAAGYQYNDSSTDTCDVPANLIGSTAGGTGNTLSDPYLICTLAQLEAIPALITASRFYKLADNIDMTGSPITAKVMTGAAGLNGGGHFLVDYTGSNAFFDMSVSAQSDLRDISFYRFTINNSQTATNENVAIAFRRFAGLIQDVAVTGTINVSGTPFGGYVGGIMGYGAAFSATAARNLFADVTISFTHTGTINGAGGFFGNFAGSATGVRGISRITAQNSGAPVVTNTGGFSGGFGLNANGLTYSAALGIASGISDLQLETYIDNLNVAAGNIGNVGGLGGVVGSGASFLSSTRIYDVHVSGRIYDYRDGGGSPHGGIIGWSSASGANVVWPMERVSSRVDMIYKLGATASGGGIVGRNDGDELTSVGVPFMNQVYFSGSITGQGSSNAATVGGLIGRNVGPTPSADGIFLMQDSFVSGSIEGHQHIGGLSGWSTLNLFRRCAFFGIAVSTNTPSSFLSALTRYQSATTDNCADSFWDVTTGPPLSFTPTVCPSGDLTTAETKVQASYVGWDFGTVWKMSDPDGRWKGRPILQWMEDE